MKKRKLYDTFKLICLICYIALSFILIIEACINGTESSEQSDQIGNALADTFNDFSGDQAKKIPPTDIVITNKIERANIGDTLAIKHNFTPSNTTFKSITYHSNNEAIASISNEGIVSFKSSGKVTITIKSKDYPNISDEMKIQVNEVKLTSLVSGLRNLNTENNVYILNTNNQYKINTDFNPKNTTDKNLTYSYSPSTFISINDSGIISAKNHSYNQITTITVTHTKTNKKSSFDVIVRNKDIIDATEINYQDLTIYKSQTKTITPTFIPYNTTYKEITLSTNRSDLITINENTITGKETGNCTLTISPKKYPNLKKEIKLNIKSQPELESLDLLINHPIVEGSKIKLIFFNIIPQYADISSINIASSNSSIVEITNENNAYYLNAKNTGLVTIFYLNKSINVEITPKSDNINSFDVNSTLNSFEIGQTYNLNNYFNISYTEQPLSTNITYSLENPSLGNINNNNLTPTKSGITNLIITHNTSGASQTILVYINPTFSITDENNNPIINNINIQYGNDFILYLDNNFHFTFGYNEDIFINNLENNKYKISCSKTGTFDLEINLIIDGNIHKGKTITINVNDSSLDGYKLDYVCFTQNMTKVNRNDDDKNLALTPKSFTYIKPLAIKNNTKYDLSKFSNVNLSYEVDNPNIIDIKKENNLFGITPLSLGKTTLTIKDISDAESNREIKINIYVFNIFTFIDNTNFYTLKGDTLKENGKDIYEITNGNSATLKVNFNYNHSTYTKVTFSSSNEEVAKIDSDGVITPLKAGKTKIKFSCYDGISDTSFKSLNTKIDGKDTSFYTNIEVSIELTIKKKDLITDLPSFLLKVRKGIGHFGAFLVLGIFSTFTYMLYFNPKKWKWSIPLNISQGIILASITEIIQLFVPGRTGLLSDILIDSAGFLISSLIITIVLLIYYFKNRHQH